MAPRIGQAASRDRKFCPLNAACKYPYKFLRAERMEAVSSAYFASGKFRDRGWSLYYVYTLLDDQTKPLILLPKDEFEDLLNEINRELDEHLDFPDQAYEPGFVLGFAEEGSPIPRYLGRLASMTSLEDAEKNLPHEEYREKGDEPLDDRSFPVFRLKMRQAIEASKKKSKAVRDRRKQNRVVRKTSWCAQLKRTHCYLGVRPRRTPIDVANPADNPSMTESEWKSTQQAYQEANCLDLSPFDPNEQVPYKFHKNVLFVCIDVEAYERPPNPITEVGISTLDTLDLMDVPPGDGGEAWRKKIRSRHFRIKENAHLNNTDFVVGCAGRFEKEFGISEFISIKDAPGIIASCFKPPFYGGEPPIELDDDPISRNIILVGHDVRNDVRYLRKLGYDVTNLAGLVEAVDTADLYRAWKHEETTRSLGTILMEVGLVGWNLHNAGNDAAYTLHAMLGISLKSLNSSAEHKAISPAERAFKIENAAREARQRVQEEAEEWERADSEGGDGGVPDPISTRGESWDTPIAEGKKYARSAKPQGPHAKPNENQPAASAKGDGIKKLEYKDVDGPVPAEPGTQVEAYVDSDNSDEMVRSMVQYRIVDKNGTPAPVKGTHLELTTTQPTQKKDSFKGKGTEEIDGLADKGRDGEAKVLTGAISQRMAVRLALLNSIGI